VMKIGILDYPAQFVDEIPSSIAHLSQTLVPDTDTIIDQANELDNSLIRPIASDIIAVPSASFEETVEDSSQMPVSDKNSGGVINEPNESANPRIPPITSDTIAVPSAPVEETIEDSYQTPVSDENSGGVINETNESIDADISAINILLKKQVEEKHLFYLYFDELERTGNLSKYSLLL
jgi:hypothetical protein